MNPSPSPTLHSPDRDAAVESIARLLADARRSGDPAPAVAVAVADSETAYAVQAAVANRLGWFAAGTARHWKSGAASRQTSGTHAALPPQGVVDSGADLGAWPFHLRGVEAEIALRLGHRVDAALARKLDVETASALIDARCVTIEIVDSRWHEGLAAPSWAKLADLQSHGALVVGPWQQMAAVDWATQRCSVQIGAKPVQQFAGTHSLGDPAAVLPDWLRHATRDGAVLDAGTLVTTGTWCGLLTADRGDRVQVQFDGFGEVSVQL